MTTTLPRWARFVPAAQFAVVLLYVLAVIFFDAILPEAVVSGLMLGSPLVFGSALGLGVWAARLRGAVRPDGSEYMIPTLANVLMGLGLGLSIVLWAFLATFPL